MTGIRSTIGFKKA